MVFDFEGNGRRSPRFRLDLTDCKMNQNLSTARLTLRPPRRGDSSRIQALCGNWNVARMLEIVPHPYPDGLAETWIEDLPAQWQSGAAYTFAIALSDELIGVIEIERDDEEAFGLGYWLGEPWWGQGYMSEAAARVIQFAFEDLRVDKLRSGHFADNPASGRVLKNRGFKIVGQGTLPCHSRGGEVAAVFVELRAGDVP